MQDKHGIGFCTGCQYFDANWDKPDLSDSNKSENLIRKKAIFEYTTIKILAKFNTLLIVLSLILLKIIHILFAG
jgi:hypothetical protein